MLPSAVCLEWLRNSREKIIPSCFEAICIVCCCLALFRPSFIESIFPSSVNVNQFVEIIGILRHVTVKKVFDVFTLPCSLAFLREYTQPRARLEIKFYILENLRGNIKSTSRVSISIVLCDIVYWHLVVRIFIGAEIEAFQGREKEKSFHFFL